MMMMICIGQLKVMRDYEYRSICCRYAMMTRTNRIKIILMDAIHIHLCTDANTDNYMYMYAYMHKITNNY